MVVGDDGDDVIIQGITDDLFDVTRTVREEPGRPKRMIFPSAITVCRFCFFLQYKNNKRSRERKKQKNGNHNNG
jgi:hypothetical protein